MLTAAELTPRRTAAFAFLLGAVTGLGQVPFSLPPVSLFALATAAWLVRIAPSAKVGAWRGFATGTGYFAVTLHWIVEPFLVDVARHGWMAPFALLFISTGFALFWALAFGMSHWLGRRGGWRFALAFALALTAAELARSYILTGFPWALLGYVYSEGSGAQLGAWIGPFGLTLIAAAGAGAAAIGVSWKIRGAAAIVAWAAPNLMGQLAMPDDFAAQPSAPIVRLIQPNAPQDEKWDAEKSFVFFRRQLDFTAASQDSALRNRLDLIIWPETAVPFLVTPDHPGLIEIARAAAGTAVLFGGQRLDGLRAFNSLFYLNEDGDLAKTYDKHHLVPFGEYMPFGGLTRIIGLPSFASQDGFGYTPGPGPATLDLGRFGRVLPLICYEAIFPQDVAGAPRRPDWLLQVTNDAWFGTFAGPQQHLAQARLRSIEQGLPMVRVANTGISGVIDAAGRVLATLPLGEAGYLDHPVPPPRGRTFYAYTGDWPLTAALLFGLLGLGIAAGRAKAA